MFARAFPILLARRRQPRRILLVVAAMPLALLALLGAQYGSFAQYAVLASICLLQAVYPTLLGWALVVASYATGLVVYLYAMLRDLIELAHGNPADIFLNPTDSVVVVLLVIVLLAIAVALALSRPKPLLAA